MVQILYRKLLIAGTGGNMKTRLVIRGNEVYELDEDCAAGKNSISGERLQIKSDNISGKQNSTEKKRNFQANRHTPERGKL